MDFKKFLRFDIFITTYLIQVVYILASLVAIGYVLFGPISLYTPLGWQLLGLTGALVAIRFYCELIIVIFKIGDNVANLAYGKSLDEPSLED